MSFLIPNKASWIGPEGYVSAEEEWQSQWNGGAEKERRDDKSEDPLQAKSVKSKLLCTQGLACVSRKLMITGVIDEGQNLPIDRRDSSKPTV